MDAVLGLELYSGRGMREMATTESGVDVQVAHAQVAKVVPSLPLRCVGPSGDISQPIMTLDPISLQSRIGLEVYPLPARASRLR